MTLAKQLEVLVAKGDGDAVSDMKSTYNIPDKRAIMTKIKVLIDTAKWEDLITFV